MVQCPYCKGTAKELEIAEVEILTNNMNVVMMCSCTENNCGHKFSVRRKYRCKYVGMEYSAKE